MPIESREAEVRSVPDVDTSGFDPGTINGPCVVSFEVDENGHVSRPHVKKSSGNSDFDDACVRAVQRARVSPAIQDHLPRSARAEWTFG